MGISPFSILLLLSGAVFLIGLLFSAVYPSLSFLKCRLILLRDRNLGDTFTVYRTSRHHSLLLKIRSEWLFTYQDWILRGLVRCVFLNLVTLKGRPDQGGWRLAAHRPRFLDGVENHWLYYSLILLPGMVVGALYVLSPEVNNILVLLGLSLYYSGITLGGLVLNMLLLCIAGRLGWLAAMQFHLLTSRGPGSLIISDRAICALGGIMVNSNFLTEVPVRAVYLPWSRVRSLTYESGQLIITYPLYGMNSLEVSRYAVLLPENDARKVIDRFKSP